MYNSNTLAMDFFVMLIRLLIMKEEMRFIPTNNNIVGFNNLISKAMIQHFILFFLVF